MRTLFRITILCACLLGISCAAEQMKSGVMYVKCFSGLNMVFNKEIHPDLKLKDKDIVIAREKDTTYLIDTDLPCIILQKESKK